MGSVHVSRHDKVKRGQSIGYVGSSGLSQMAHVHFSIRHNGKTMDPFINNTLERNCVKQPLDPQNVLWTVAALKAFPYKNGELISTKFIDTPISLKDLETGRIVHSKPHKHSLALVFYARFLNLKKHDQIRILIEGPNGTFSKNTLKPLPRFLISL